MKIETPDRMQSRHAECLHNVSDTESSFRIAQRRHATDGLVVRVIAQLDRTVQQAARNANVIDSLDRTRAGFGNDLAVDLDFTGRDEAFGFPPRGNAGVRQQHVKADAFLARFRLCRASRSRLRRRARLRLRHGLRR